MLEQLLIQNFQTHGKLRVDFGPDITTIVGPSDVGKSAIIRALRWVCSNQPGGDAFIRHGTKGCTVKLYVDGKTISRRRNPGGSINTYHIGDAEYKAFGRGVPEPVEQLLNLGPVCWQGQHDAPYWFGASAGEVSRQLNTIVNLGIIDTTLAGVASTFNTARIRLSNHEGDLSVAKHEYDALAWVPRFAGAVDALVVVEDAATDKRQQATTVARLLRAARLHHEAHERATAAASRGEVVLKTGTVAIEAQDRVGALLRLIETARTCAITARAPVPDIGPLEAAREQYEESMSQAMALQTLIETAKERKAILCQNEKDLKAAEAAMPKRCPTCGQYS